MFKWRLTLVPRLLGRAIASSNRWVAAAGFALFVLRLLSKRKPKTKKVRIDLSDSGKYQIVARANPK